MSETERAREALIREFEEATVQSYRGLHRNDATERYRKAKAALRAALGATATEPAIATLQARLQEARALVPVCTHDAAVYFDGKVTAYIDALTVLGAVPVAPSEEKNGTARCPATWSNTKSGCQCAADEGHRGRHYNGALEWDAMHAVEQP